LITFLFKQKHHLLRIDSVFRATKGYYANFHCCFS
jgi:hypothetical protein